MSTYQNSLIYIYIPKNPCLYIYNFIICDLFYTISFSATDI